ncbi:MAG TPA: tetratricopeptide repeat protein [Candidatus Acidoferrales bacterium]|nr:tetratricopeptide repeat protein [Candidatus Acidoferrales bacterium]
MKARLKEAMKTTRSVNTERMNFSQEVARLLVGMADKLTVSFLLACVGMTSALAAQPVKRNLSQAQAQNRGHAAQRDERGAFEVTSLLGRKLYAQPDDAAVIDARKKLAAHPKNVSLILTLSQAQANRRQYREAIATCTKGLTFAPKNADLYIERGHRELGLREFRAAERDLAHAASLDPKKLDAFYHLGLSYYFQGQFAAAADSFRKALVLAKTNDSVIDCSNWLYVSLRRAGQSAEAAQALKRITPSMKNTEPHLLFYLRLERFYQGALTEQAVLPPKPANPNDTEAELAFDTVTYGVGNWHLYNKHDTKRATSLFREVVTGNAWNAWGFIGSEVALAHSRASHKQ